MCVHQSWYKLGFERFLRPFLDQLDRREVVSLLHLDGEIFILVALGIEHQPNLVVASHQEVCNDAIDAVPVGERETEEPTSEWQKSLYREEWRYRFPV